MHALDKELLSFIQSSSLSFIHHYAVNNMVIKVLKSALMDTQDSFGKLLIKILYFCISHFLNTRKEELYSCKIIKTISINMLKTVQS